MRFFGRTKFCFDAEMDLDDSALEPASAALLEFGGFLNFNHAQQSAIKGPGLVFFTHGHGQLHVVNRAEREMAHALILSGAKIPCAVHPSEHFLLGQ